MKIRKNKECSRSTKWTRARWKWTRKEYWHENTVGPTISPTRIFTSARFLQPHFPCVNIHVLVCCMLRARTAVLFYFLFSIFLGNARLYRKCSSIIKLN